MSFCFDGKVKTPAVARIYCPITADLDSENWGLNFPVVHAASDLGLILVNHTVILAVDCLLTSSSTKGSRSQDSGHGVNSMSPLWSPDLLWTGGRTAQGNVGDSRKQGWSETSTSLGVHGATHTTGTGARIFVSNVKICICQRQRFFFNL